MNFVDLFCGIGGFRLGLEKASKICNGIGKNTQGNGDPKTFVKGIQKCNEGSQFRGNTAIINRGQKEFNCVWSNDNNKYARQVYKKNFGEEPDGRDIRAVNADELPDFELLCAGFPCQSFSIAGKRKGFEDTRGTLFYELARIIKARKPQIVFLENVKGLLSAQKGYCFHRIIEVLDELGYCVQWQVLDSQYFEVPQHRERVFVVGHLGGKGFKKIFPIREGIKVNSKQESNKEFQEQNISNTLRTNYSKGYSNETYIQEGSGSMIELTENVSDAQRIYSSDGIAKSLKGLGGGQGAKTGLYAVGCAYRTRTYCGQEGHIEFRKDNLANQLTTIRKDSMVMNNSTQIRRLTPVECERLQGFPDGFTSGLSDTQRYKCLGNAVTTNVIEAIGRRLLN